MLTGLIFRYYIYNVLKIYLRICLCSATVTYITGILMKLAHSYLLGFFCMETTYTESEKFKIECDCNTWSMVLKHGHMDMETENIGLSDCRHWSLSLITGKFKVFCFFSNLCLIFTVLTIVPEGYDDMMTQLQKREFWSHQTGK